MSTTVSPDTAPVSAALVDAVLRDLAREQSCNDYLVCAWLLRGDELGVERLHGYASLREYGERVLGLGGRGVEDRLRVARVLRELPALRERFADGEVRYTVVRELCRVATAETESEWLEAAEGRTGAEVRDLVLGRERGDRPTDRAKPERVTRRLTLELTPEAYALFVDARRAATERAGGHVDDSALVTEVSLAYLVGGGTRDEGVSAYQIALTVDPHGGAVIEAGSESVAVDPVTLERARCDAQALGVVDGAAVAEGTAARAVQTVPPRTRRSVLARDKHRCAVPGCRHAAFLEVHHVVPRAQGGGHHADNLVGLCTGHHRAAHDGALVLRGSAGRDLAFFHADGRPYGSRAPGWGGPRGGGAAGVSEAVASYARCA